MYENKFVCPCCSGDIAIGSPEQLTGNCKVCGREVFIPRSDTKRINRINYFRNTLSFEKAFYNATRLTEEFPEDGSVWFALFLCEYSIQYVKEGAKFVPVCRKDPSLLPPVGENENYKKAVSFAQNEEEKKFYESCAAEIDECINKARNSVDQEKNYDIYVLSREGVSTDDDFDGDRLYLRFKENMGFNVFYVPELLKDSGEVEKAANVIYAVKNSKILLAPFRTKDDTFDGFLNYVIRVFCKVAEKDEEKLIYPIFDSSKISFQQLPDKLVMLDEAFDCSDDEFMREISDKIEKILKPESAAIAPEAINTVTAANKENLIKRAYMFLEDGEFDTADTYFDKILDIDIEESRAYIGKLLASCKLKSEDEIPNLPQTVTDDKNFKKALRFASPEQKAHYESLNGAIVDRIESEKKRISEERQRITAERAAAEEAERARRERQNKEERKLEFKRRQEPLKNTLTQIQAELGKAFLSGKRKKELEEQEETVKRNLKNLEMLFADIYD